MDDATRATAEAECDLFRDALQEAVDKFGLHAAVVVAVGDLHGQHEHLGYQTMLISGCEQCAAGALAHAIRRLPLAMRQPFMQAWIVETAEANAEAATEQNSSTTVH